MFDVKKDINFDRSEKLLYNIWKELEKLNNYKIENKEVEVKIELPKKIETKPKKRGK